MLHNWGVWIIGENFISPEDFYTSSSGAHASDPAFKNTYLVIPLMVPHVALKLGGLWKRQQTDLTFVEGGNLVDIVSVFHVQCQDSIYKIT